tara:strand:+ start:757 stop:1398 length:642 start_codon:yes stop_codon:yes gene_type:complete
MSFVAAGLAAASLVGGGIKAIGAGKAKRQAERKERKARKEMNRMKEAYSQLDTSNPYANMENTMEDLTVNQKQAQFEAQQFQQSQANILDSVRGASGGSGVAAIAQQLAQSGQLAAQKSAASIGAQEAANQTAAAQQGARNQELKAQGERESQRMERDKVGTLLGMSQAETAQYGQAAAGAQQAVYGGIGEGISGAASSVMSGIDAGLMGKKD